MELTAQQIKQILDSFRLHYYNNDHDKFLAVDEIQNIIHCIEIGLVTLDSVFDLNGYKPPIDGDI